jgi:hypothetical protein
MASPPGARKRQDRKQVMKNMYNILVYKVNSVLYMQNALLSVLIPFLCPGRMADLIYLEYMNHPFPYIQRNATSFILYKNEFYSAFIHEVRNKR